MATYSTIKGFTIQSVETDPYTSEIAAGTWASANALNTARKNPGGIGLAGAAVCVGGQPDSPTVTDAVEEYDGTSWTTVTAIPVAQCFVASGGILTAGWVTAGNDDGGGSAPFPTTMNLYDGTNWTTGNPILTGRYAATGSGPTTSAFIAGGAIPPGSPGGVTTTEKYDGTSWTASGAMNTNRYSGMSSGTATAGLIAGGHSSGSLTANAETFDGSTWTETGDLNLARQRGAVGGGTAPGTGALVAGGYQDSSPPLYVTVNTESFDGTTWTEVANLGAGVAGQGFATSGNTSALSFGGDNPPTSEKTTTEVWEVPSSVSVAQIGQVWYNIPSAVLKGYSQALGTGTWASTGSLNTVRPNNFGGGSGTQIAALAFGGYTVPAGVTNATESYNGSTWTETGHTMNTARYKTAACGTQTATLCFSGNAVSPSETDITEEYNGSTWAVKNTMPTSKADGTGAGTTSAAKYYSGRGPSTTVTTAVFDYDGTNWSVGTSNNTARSQGGGGGTSTDAVFVGGGPPVVANYEAWNGSAWVEKADLNSGRRAAAASVTNTNSVMLAGGEPGYKLTELFDGTSWSEQADQANEHYNNASATTSATAALAISNTDSPYALCEEWTVPSITAIKTFTSS